MRLLLDENIAPRLAATLRQLGHDANHIDEIGWKSKSDAQIFRDALEHGYDALITKNRHRGSARRPSLEAMRDGLRIILLRFGANVVDTPSRQVALVSRHLTDIEAAFTPQGDTRRLILHAVLGVVGQESISEIEAMLTRRDADLHR